jgi:IS1 family transposase
MRDRIWICRDGRRLFPGEMDDGHLARSIAKIERERSWRKSWLPRLRLEQDIRRATGRPSPVPGR